MTKIPASFPRQAEQGSVSGAQPKLLVRIENGNYVSGQSEEELQERYLICQDLVHQLEGYCMRKRCERPSEALKELLKKIRVSVLNKPWGLAEHEVDWIMEELKSLLEGR